MNTVSLIGRVTADPETRAGEKTESASFRRAIPHRSSEDADFVDIVTFGKLAATCGDYLSKGRQVAVTGRLHLSEWVNGDGERRSKLQVVADDVSFFDKPKTSSGGGNGAADADEIPDRPAMGRYRKPAPPARAAPTGPAAPHPGVAGPSSSSLRHPVSPGSDE